MQRWNKWILLHRYAVLTVIPCLHWSRITSCNKIFWIKNEKVETFSINFVAIIAIVHKYHTQPNTGNIKNLIRSLRAFTGVMGTLGSWELIYPNKFTSTVPRRVWLRSAYFDTVSETTCIKHWVTDSMWQAAASVERISYKKEV